MGHTESRASIQQLHTNGLCICMCIFIGAVQLESSSLSCLSWTIPLWLCLPWTNAVLIFTHTQASICQSEPLCPLVFSETSSSVRLPIKQHNERLETLPEPKRMQKSPHTEPVKPLKIKWHCAWRSRMQCAAIQKDKPTKL